MEIFLPDYFDRFQCLAGRCPDSCCQEWEIQVDPETADRYRTLPGALGDRLRQVMETRDGDTVLTIQDGRCPIWRRDGLCAIQAELGEGALCRTCREFPRLTHDYGDFQEQQLELSCPEAARWILGAETSRQVVRQVPGGRAPEYDAEAMKILRGTRSRVLRLLEEPACPVETALTKALLWGRAAQAGLDAGQMPGELPEDAADQAWRLAEPGDMEGILACFRGLEILTDRWRERLAQPRPGPWRREHLALARYLAERYWLQAVSDYDLNSRVTLMIVSCLLVRHLGGDVVQTAQLFSKEIENSADNLDALLDAAYDNPAFSDGNLLGLLGT